MRIRRRKSSDELDSLELLLDTICNTFGGILFLAMLVCILSASPVNHGADDAARKEAIAEARLKQLDAAEHLKRTTEAARDSSVAAMQSTVDFFFPKKADKEERARFEAWETDKARVASLTRETDALREEIERQEDGERQRADSLNLWRTSLAGVQDDVKVAREELAKLPATKRETLRLPQMRSTEKRQVVAIVSNGRLFAGIYPSEMYRGAVPLYRGCTGGLSNEVRVSEIPNALGSAKIEDGEAARRALAGQRVLGLDRRSCYVVFAVWPDSHREYELLRDALVEEGWDYDLFVMTERESLRWGSGGGNHTQ